MTPRSGIARVLIVAGSDSGGGAGIQADIRTVTMLGGHPMTAITAITAQNTLGVQAVHPVPVDIVVTQMRSVIDDLGIDAVKIGMIGSAEIAHAVADMLETVASCPVVFDPVMIATSGAILADEATTTAFARLMRRATLVTPNLPELAALGGEAAVLSHGAALLAKGGHGEGHRIEDRLITGDGETVWTHDRIDTVHSHGTGCTLASGIATGLAQGMTLSDACDRAISYVQSALAAAPNLGGGHGPMGHALATTPYYHLLAASDRDGWDAAALAARWP
ncbi:bifunctional hydroxymethylpyrimidine kinase/phosphomethylpyrimidine kinase [Sphingomonas cynarae]|uniref:hydroxymethylpyrimidine kinase n=1 Tax=Sphingomonas cynarae TaxID=930197 RepID=A0ABP7DCW3_9SPHN